MSRFGFGHQRVFGSFVLGFVGDREAQERPGIVPRHGHNRVLGDQILAGRLGRFERCAAGQALAATWRVEKIRAAGHLCT